MPANINIDPNIALGIKQNDSLTNLSSLLNMANTAQQFEQLQRTNPLALEKMQMEIAQQRKLNPLTVRQQTEAANQAEISTAKSGFDLQQQHENIGNAALTALITSPHFQPKENSEHTDEDKKAMLKDIDAVERMMKAQGVKAGKGGAADILRERVNSDPKTAIQFLQNVAVGQMGASERVGLTKPSNITISGVPALQNTLTGEVSPLTIKGEAETPKIDMKAKPPSPEYENELSYPVRKPNQPFVANPSETVALQQGQLYRKSLQETNNPQILSKTKRDLFEVDKKVDEITQKAIDLGWINSSTGLWGALTRKKDEIIGNPEYQQLSKDIANLQISQMTAGGGSLQTDSGKDLVRHSTGDATYAPEVLKNIIGRITSDVTNKELQQQAADKFARRFGDQNIATFQKQWNQNVGDGKIFEAWHINNTLGDKNPNKANEMIQQLLGKPNTKEFEDNMNKLQNIEDLVNYGYISKRK
jgi:hypothetical protein